MIKNILTILLRLFYDSRRSFFWLFVTAFALGGMFVSIFPSLTQSGVDFNEYLKAFPPALVEVFGLHDADFNDFEVFISTEYLSLFWAIAFAPFLISWAVEIAREAESGTLALSLSYPVSRVETLLAHAINLKLRALTTALFLVGGLLIPAQFIDAEIQYKNWLIYTFILFVNLLFISFFTLMCALLFKKSGKAISVSAGFLVIGYFLSIVSKLVDSLEGLKYLSIFYHFGEPIDILQRSELNLSSVALLILLSILMFGVSFTLFRKQDLNQG